MATNLNITKNHDESKLKPVKVKKNKLSVIFITENFVNNEKFINFTS